MRTWSKKESCRWMQFMLMRKRAVGLYIDGLRMGQSNSLRAWRSIKQRYVLQWWSARSRNTRILQNH